MLKMDVRDDDSVRQAVKEIISREGRIDSVFNNAGTGISESLEETTQRSIRSFLKATILVWLEL